MTDQLILGVGLALGISGQLNGSDGEQGVDENYFGSRRGVDDLVETELKERYLGMSRSKWSFLSCLW
jgi:hypothetical protein